MTSLYVVRPEAIYSCVSDLQILKPADKKLYSYGGGGGMGSGRPVTPPRNSAKGAKAKK